MSDPFYCPPSPGGRWKRPRCAVLPDGQIEENRMENFAFGIAESLSLAREILEGETEISMDKWDRVERYYRRRKKNLIAALCPETARREYKIEVSPEPGEARQWYVSACVDLAVQAVNEGAGHLHDALISWGRHVEASDVSENAVLDGSRLFGMALAQGAKIKKGMKLSRALAAVLEEADSARKEVNAPRVVDMIDQKAQAKKKTINFVVSANPFDILFCSEHAGYTSCHGITGGCRAGPQQYLSDDTTIVVYAWTQLREWNGYMVPFKLFRQMVYIDQKRQAAALQRYYGQAFHDSFYEAVREQIAHLLARLAGKEEKDLKWYKSRERCTINTGCGLAYLDSTVNLVQLQKGDGGRPFIQLAKRVPCSACIGFLDNTEKLLCNKCDDSVLCRSCSCRQMRRSMRSYGASYYCEKCYEQCFTRCGYCSRTIMRTDGRFLPEFDMKTLYCTACYYAKTFVCAYCTYRHQVSDEKDGCGVKCAALMKKARLLYERLKKSPLWNKVDRPRKIELRQRWYNIRRIPCLAANFVIPTETTPPQRSPVDATAATVS